MFVSRKEFSIIYIQIALTFLLNKIIIIMDHQNGNKTKVNSGTDMEFVIDFDPYIVNLLFY